MASWWICWSVVTCFLLCCHARCHAESCCLLAAVRLRDTSICPVSDALFRERGRTLRTMTVSSIYHKPLFPVISLCDGWRCTWWRHFCPFQPHVGASSLWVLMYAWKDTWRQCMQHAAVSTVHQTAEWSAVTDLCILNTSKMNWQQQFAR